MTRPPDGSQLRGETQIVEPAWSWTDAPPGRLWQAKGQLPDDDDPLRAARGIGIGLLIALPVWVGIIAFLWWALS